MTFSLLLKSATQSLKSHRVPDAAADAEMILLHVLQTDRLTAYRDDPEVPIKKEILAQSLLSRRAEGEPVQYIVGHIDFLGLFIRVGSGVLIPRPETELLVQGAIKTLGSRLPDPGKKNSCPSILDLCTGSGCIALALARAFPDAAVTAVDISETALVYARENAVLNGITNTSFLMGSLFAPLNSLSRHDLITANPPYIRSADIPCLQKEVRDWEPLEALDGGEDGLDFYREIFSGAEKFLTEKGSLLLEIGFGQAEVIGDIARRKGFSIIEVLKDFAGIDRILKAGK